MYATTTYLQNSNMSNYDTFEFKYEYSQTNHKSSIEYRDVF